jgi:hypothetical protein
MKKIKVVPNFSRIIFLSSWMIRPPLRHYTIAGNPLLLQSGVISIPVFF